MPQGPSAAPANATGLQVTACTSFTVGAADAQMSTYFTCGIARRIIPQAAGNVFIQRPGDAGFTKYVVLASVPIEGQIVAIGGTTGNPTATTMTIVLEV